MAEATAQSLIQRYEELAGERGTWESSWQEIADHELGRRDFTTQEVIGGKRRMQHMYDTTALLSISLLSGGLHSMLTNPAAEWFRLKPEEERLMQIRSVALWFEMVEESMYNAIQQPEARFASQIHETYVDIVGFGTGGHFIADVPGRGVYFSARPLSELYVSENASGVIDTVFRRFRYTARQSVEAWGNNAPDRAHKAVEKGNSEDKADYIHVVMPTDTPVFVPFRDTGMPYQSIYLSLDEKKILSAGGFEEMPYMVPRWEKDAGETYGRGPGWTALADAKMLNEMKKTSLQAGQMAVRPPVMVEDDGVVPQLDMRPGGVNAVRAGGILSPPIQAIDVRSRAEIGIELIRDTRKQVQDAFHWELLQLIRDPRMTATQVIEISSNVQRLLSPILGRLNSEMLEPIIERVFGILLRQGRLPRPPPEIEGMNIRVEYVSPVARAQKDGDAKSIVELFTVGANLSQVDPTVLSVLDTEEAVRFIASAKGVPLAVLRSRAEVEKIRQAQQQVAQQEQQQEQAAQTVDAVAKLAPIIQQQSEGA